MGAGLCRCRTDAGCFAVFAADEKAINKNGLTDCRLARLLFSLIFSSDWGARHHSASYAPLEKGEEQRIVSPNESLSMYLSITATHVKCSNGEIDIKALMDDHGFKDAANLDPGSSKDEEEAE